MTNLKKLLTIVLLLFAGLLAAEAQTSVVGTVTDVKGETLIGVNVTIKGTTKGTITDLNGKFSISVPGSSTVLAFSYIGYISQEVKVGSQKTISVVLKEDAKSLDEVVVIGYQEVKRRDLTGATGKANLEGMLKAPTASLDQALAGRVAGVQVSASEGTPGSSMNIVIRGTNSVTGSNSPLYVIDGFPVEESSASAALNKNDVESMEILKDASATAIYGARGANGVIMITTKKGTVGVPVIAYEGSTGVQKVSRLIPMMNAYDFVKLQQEIGSQYAGLYLQNPTVTTDTRSLDDYRNIEQYDWQKNIFRQALIQNHSVSITGGKEDIRYSASLSYFDQDGIVKNSSYNRMQGRLNTTIKKGKSNIYLSLNYSKGTQQGSVPSESTFSGQNNLFYSVWGYRPVTYVGVPLSSLVNNITDNAVDPANDYRFNPIMSLKNEYNQKVTNVLQANGFWELEMAKGLKFKTTLGYTEDSRDNEVFNNSKTRYGNVNSQLKVNGSVFESKRQTWLNENTLTFNKSIDKKHNFSSVVGYTMQASDYRDNYLQASGIKNEQLGMSSIPYGTPYLTDYNASRWTMMSFLGRLNYNYRSKYYATASFRADGSSKFKGKNQFGYFPSGSLAWNFSEEKFMKPLADQISSGKLRISWGVTGNNRVGDYDTYARLQQITAASGNYTLPGDLFPGIYPFNNQITSNGPVPISLQNEGLRWESTSQWNIGTDLTFFKQRAILNVDLYKKVTSDLLLEAQLPYSSGYGQGTKNIGKTQNQGLEISLTTKNIRTKKFTWSTSFNIAFNQNKVVALNEGQTSLLQNAPFDQTYNTSPNYIAMVGHPLGMMYGYIYDGTYKYSDFDLTGPTYKIKPGVPAFSAESNTQPGYPKYRDLNGDGKITSSDQTVIGKGAPLHIGGLANDFEYKNFDLSIFFQWSYGNDALNANRLMFESGNQKKAELNQFASYSDRWTVDNPTSDIPRAITSSSMSVFSSRVIEDASFLRLKNITLGYNLDKRILKTLGLSKVRVYLTAQDLWTLTKYTGYDPEVSVRNSALTPGLDFSSYPQARSFNGGINVTF